MMHRSLLIASLIVSSSAWGCRESDPSSGTSQPKVHASQEAAAGLSAEERDSVVAKIDGQVITVGDFHDELMRQSPYIRARYTSLEQKKEFLDNLIRREVLAKEAESRKLDQAPEVVRNVKQLMIQRLMREEFESRVKLEEITEAELKAFYDTQKDEYNRPEMVRAAVILVKDEAKANRIMAEVRTPEGSTNKGYRDLVLAHSEDEASKVRGGDLLYFPIDDKNIPQPVVKAAFAIPDIGGVVGPIKTDAGYYIVKQTGRRQPVSKSFDEVKLQIRNRLFREKRAKAMDEFVASLKQKATVVVNEDALAKVKVDTTLPEAGVAPPDPAQDP